MEYTKGEWEAWDKYIMCDGVSIAKVNSASNAHLIAAASDMYEAIKKIMARQEITPDGEVAVRSTPSSDEVLEMSKALAKAEGR